MPMLAFSVSLTSEPSEKVAPPPVMPKVLVLPLFRAAGEREAHVQVVVAIGDVGALHGSGGAIDVHFRVRAEGLAAGAAGDGERSADGRDADKLVGTVALAGEGELGRRWPTR